MLPFPHLQSETAIAIALQTARREALKWLGLTSPNPPVGAAALDIKGNIIAVAAHQRAGTAHAEARLIEECRAKGILKNVHTLCVTLEPCNHHGRTPPCTEAIIRSGIKHVAIGTRDPNPHVAGGGIERLKQAGIEVINGVEEEDCKQIIHAFAYKMQSGKPWVTIKRAFNEAGSMLPAAGQKTFTSPSSLKLAHQLRKKADAILTGSGTILADNPLFTVRHVNDYADKRRWLGVLDRRGRVSETYIKAATERGLDAIIYRDVAAAIDDLSKRGAQDILVEAGPALSQAVLDYDLWAMSVSIRQAEPDSIEVSFHPKAALPFNADEFCWDNFLPLE